MVIEVFDDKNYKIFKYGEYEYYFNKHNGYFERKGNVEFSPIGAEIVDIEVVKGGCYGKCKFCYKDNNINKDIVYMSLNRFKELFYKLPKSVCQIAFGITDIDINPDLCNMMKFCRENDYNDVIPNLTINSYKDISDKFLEVFTKYCGSIAVSFNYVDKDKTYDIVSKLIRFGCKQVNIHIVLSKNTYGSCLKIIDDIKKDRRLDKLNAILFLSLKSKGSLNNYSIISNDDFKYLCDKIFKENLRVGFDSCIANYLIKYVKENNLVEFEKFIEPCESSLFSLYINVYGDIYPCSFLEGEDFKINIFKINDFINEVWYNNDIVYFRNELLKNNRYCLKYKILE